MHLLAASLFLSVAYGLGCAGLALSGRRHAWGNYPIALAVGLGLAAPVLLVLRVLHVALDYRLLAGLAVAGVLGSVLASRRPGRLRDEVPNGRQRLALHGAFAAAVALAALMVFGANRYPYLEDDDPWEHAAGARYVATVKTTAQQAPRASHYLEPYPPYYTALMGVLHQVDDDLRGMVKLVNAAIVGLSLVAAFLAYRVLAGDATALVAVLVLAWCPGYMSHFIWAQSLAIPAFLIAIWALRSVGEPARIASSGAFWLATFLVWSATIIQPSTAPLFALLLVTLAAEAGLVRWRRERRLSAQAVAVVSGGVLSFTTWAGWVAAYGWEALREAIGISAAMFAGGASDDTSGGIVYSLADFVFPARDSKIDQATGIGWGLSLLALAGVASVLLRARRTADTRLHAGILMIGWLAFGIVGVEGNALPVKLFPHRFWVFVAIPAAYLAAEGIASLASLLAGRVPRALAWVVLGALAIVPNIEPRLAMQTAVWPPGVAWRSQVQLVTYLELAERVPAWTRVLSPCSAESLLIGSNLAAEPWDPALARLKEGLASATAEGVHAFMRDRRYEVVILDANCLDRMGGERLQALFDGLRARGLQVMVSRQGIAILRDAP